MLFLATPSLTLVCSPSYFGLQSSPLTNSIITSNTGASLCKSLDDGAQEVRCWNCKHEISSHAVSSATQISILGIKKHEVWMKEQNPLSCSKLGIPQRNYILALVLLASGSANLPRWILAHLQGRIQGLLRSVGMRTYSESVFYKVYMSVSCREAPSFYQINISRLAVVRCHLLAKFICACLRMWSVVNVDIRGL